MGGGSWLRFTSGSTTAIQEAWGLTLIGDFNHPVKINNASFLIGYNSAGENLGTNNLLVNGKVGIGTTTPLSSLHVNGNISLAAAAGPSNTYLQFQRDWDSYTGARIGNAYGMNGYTGDLVFETNHGGGPSDLVEGMRVTSSGNVGVGTTDTKGYKLAVNVNLIATSVTVKLYSAWPDYVFKPTYYLKPLSEVKIYIGLNHRLPEMPSEKEVAERGIDLGEMNKLLAKKVEELTLYLIEKDSQIKDLSAGADNQKKLMIELEERLKALEKAK